MPVKLGIFAFYPDIFRAPLWSRLASSRKLDICVYYFATEKASGSNPTNDGKRNVVAPVASSAYKSKFIQVAESNPLRAKIPNADAFFRQERLDVAVIDGCYSRCEQQIRKYAEKYHFRIILRGEMGLSALMAASGVPEFMSRTLRQYPFRIRRTIDAFCPTGRYAEQRLLEQGIAPEKIFPSPFAIDTGAVEAQKKRYCREAIRKELDLSEDATVFLFAGDLTPIEKPLVVADAVTTLKNYPRIAMIFLGTGKLAPVIEQKLRPLLQERLLMPGSCDFDSSGCFFAIADVLVMPSGHGAGGPTVALAMHWEMPSIICDKCGDGGELIINGYTGFSYREHEIDALVRYMRKFLAEPELAVKMGFAARQEAGNYTVEEGVAGIVGALKYIGKNKREKG